MTLSTHPGRPTKAATCRAQVLVRDSIGELLPWQDPGYLCALDDYLGVLDV